MRRRDYCRFGPFRVGIIPQGLLKPIILNLLYERPMHGFEIMEEIHRASHHSAKRGEVCQRRRKIEKTVPHKQERG